MRTYVNHFLRITCCNKEEWQGLQTLGSQAEILDG